MVHFSLSAVNVVIDHDIDRYSLWQFVCIC